VVRGGDAVKDIDRALLAVELATRLGTTPALRASFAPVVWRVRAVLATRAETSDGQVKMVGSGVPEWSGNDSGAQSFPAGRHVDALSHGCRAVSDALDAPIAGARQVPNASQTLMAAALSMEGGR
jgi:hypothetical protein